MIKACGGREREDDAYIHRKFSLRGLRRVDHYNMLVCLLRYNPKEVHHPVIAPNIGPRWRLAPLKFRLDGLYGDSILLSNLLPDPNIFLNELCIFPDQ